MGKSKKKEKEKEKAKRPAFRSSPPGGRLKSRSETGARDETYDLVSVLYHALQGAETCGTYLEDAEADDNDDLAEFFEDTRAEHVARATLAKQLLLSRLLEEEEKGDAVNDGGPDERGDIVYEADEPGDITEGTHLYDEEE